MNRNRSRKISTACGACKQRKTKCSGGQPCEACAVSHPCLYPTFHGILHPQARSSPCDYDASSDQRRVSTPNEPGRGQLESGHTGHRSSRADTKQKIANQRNVQDLAQAQHELDRYRQLLGGLISIIRGGSQTSNSDLINMVRNGADVSPPQTRMGKAGDGAFWPQTTVSGLLGQSRQLSLFSLVLINLSPFKAIRTDLRT